MSWGRLWPPGRSPRPKPVPPPTPTPVVVIDEDDDSEVFIINDPAEISRAEAACNSKKVNSSGSNVINLDDDEDDDKGGGGGGDRAGPSTAGAGRSPATATPPGRASPRNRYGLNYVSDSEQSDLSEGSDSDSDGDGSSDCEILHSVAARNMWESAASRRTMPREPPRRQDGRASTSASSAESSTHHGENLDDLFASGHPLDDDNFWDHYAFKPAGPTSSGHPQDDNFWEHAFNPVGPSSATGSKYGAGPSSVPSAHKSPVDDVSKGKEAQDRNPACSLHPDMACNDKANHSHKGPVPEKAAGPSSSGRPLDDNFWEHAFNPVGPSSASGSKYGTGPSSVPSAHKSPVDDASNGKEAQDRNPACSLYPDMACNDKTTHSHKGPVSEKARETSHPPHSNETLNPEGYTGSCFVSKNRVFPACSADWKDDSLIFVSTPERKDLVDDPEKFGLSAVQDGIIGAREKHKESDEYKRATEEEWASRQRQLAIQAEEAKEAKRLRKRKKAEALRLLDMEKRQKQRIEEVRETERKREEDIQLKEQCRGAVRLELENVERTCRDVSSILRALGIPVEGGVVKAYKKALLKFHPDRVSRTDIYQQVKAEETFKFISRFKEKLKL